MCKISSNIIYDVLCIFWNLTCQCRCLAQTQLNSAVYCHCCVTLWCLCINYHSYWSWPNFVGSEERNQWFTSFVPLQNVVHVTLLPPYIVRKWLYKQYELFCLTRNGAEKYGRFSTDSHNSVIFLGVLVSKDQEIKKTYIFCFQFSNAWAQNFLEAFYPWLICVSMLWAIWTVLTKSWCLSITYISI